MVYTGEAVSGNGNAGFHYNQSVPQQDGVYSTEYELVGAHSSCNNTLLEFDNPLYSDRGPVTFTENELVSLTCCFAYYICVCVCIHAYPMGILHNNCACLLHSLQAVILLFIYMCFAD